MIIKFPRLQGVPGAPAPGSQGMALVLCLLLITTLCLVGGAALTVSGINQKIVHNGALQVQAFYLAETGRNLALSYLESDPLWRGSAGTPPSRFSGELEVNGRTGRYDVTLWDCTADENGLLNALIPAGHVRVESTGTWMDASHRVAGLIRIRPVDGSGAAFAPVAVISSGTVSGALVALDEMGDEDALLVLDGAVLPAANANALKTLADRAFSVMDDDVFDADLGGIDRFWRDAPADTRPHIVYVTGNLAISGDRQLHGIWLVEGTHVAIEEESGVDGVLYAPNATSVTFQNGGASGRIVAKGLVVTGSGGVWQTGNPVSVQAWPEYVAAFNNAAGAQVEIEAVPGSWGAL